MTEQFDIIVADPPWRSEFGRTDSRSAERHYATMERFDICTYAPMYHRPTLAQADSALLFLWCPMPMLETGLAVVTAWGFRYRTGMVWCKPSFGVGQWFRGQHELVLLGRRGSFPAPARGTQPGSVLHAPRRRHSEKPEELQDAIERTYPGLRYLELFARRERPGWTCWGDQVASPAPPSTPAPSPTPSSPPSSPPPSSAPPPSPTPSFEEVRA